MDGITESKTKEFYLKIKYLKPVSENFDANSFDISDYEIDVKEGDDGEFGMDGDLAAACGFADGESIKVLFDENHAMIIEKV